MRIGVPLTLAVVLVAAAPTSAQEVAGVIGSYYPSQLVRGQSNVLYLALGRNNPVMSIEITPSSGITVKTNSSRDLNQGSIWYEFSVDVAADAAPGPRTLVAVQRTGRTAPITLMIPDHAPAISNLRVTSAQATRPTVDVQFTASNPGGTFGATPYVWFTMSCGPQPEVGVVRGKADGTVLRASIPNPRMLQDKAAAPSVGSRCTLELRATDESNTDSNTATVTFDFTS